MHLRECLKSLSLPELWTLHEDVTSELAQKLELELEQRIGELERAENVSDLLRSGRRSTRKASLFRRRLALRRSSRHSARATIFVAVAPVLAVGADFAAAGGFAG